MKIAVTGHRPDKLGGYATCDKHVAIQRHMSELVTNLHASHSDLELLSGGAQGIDKWWIETGLSLNIPVHAILPFKGHDKKWPRASREELRLLLDRCQSVRYHFDPPPSDYSGVVEAMHGRNAELVKECDVLIAYWNGSHGGTAQTVSTASLQKKTTYIFNPDEIMTESHKNERK